MNAGLVYLKTELKRACKNLPYTFAGAIVLMALLGTIAFSASKLLYGDARMGRIAMGVVIPENDALAGQVMKMLGSLESVKSVCDFTYVEEEEGVRRLKNGEFYGLLMVPEGWIEGIMNGTNTPVTMLMPQHPGVESLVFKELTQSGAMTLGASQAGIYAADALLRRYGLEQKIPQAEEELNDRYLGYAVPRLEYFADRQVSATGDVSPARFYAIGAYVLYVLLCGIPMSGYLKPCSGVLAGKLRIIGVSRWTVAASRTAGAFMILAAVSAPVAILALASGAVEYCWYLAPMVLMVCLAAASMIVLVYELAGSSMGGVLLLFFGSVAMMFLAGGFLPLVFLPRSARTLAPFLPVTMLMDGVKTLFSAEPGAAVWIRLAALTALCLTATGVRKR